MAVLRADGSHYNDHLPNPLTTIKLNLPGKDQEERNPLLKHLVLFIHQADVFSKQNNNAKL
ncbi:hypothetical protein SFRURICE_004775 [Spodoptera frugiperda]|nr:hypothetical protein SFRURICE_004775 [Spodoptera frugiperda]